MNNYRIFETEQLLRDIEKIVFSGQPKVTRKLVQFVYPRCEYTLILDQI